MFDARQEVIGWASAGALASERVPDALRVAGVVPSAAQWRVFVERLLAWLGTTLIAAALCYFVAANWHELGRYAKFATVEASLVAAVAVACWQGLDALAGRVALFAAALVTGVLLALIGQVYQTGADVYELFAAWALFILPWVVVGRQPALWLLWIALVDVAVLLLFRTNAARGIDVLDLLFTTRAALWWVLAVWLCVSSDLDMKWSSATWVTLIAPLEASVFDLQEQGWWRLFGAAVALVSGCFLALTVLSATKRKRWTVLLAHTSVALYWLSTLVVIYIAI